MIRRPPRSTLSSSSAASDVYKRQGDYHSETRAKDMAEAILALGLDKPVVGGHSLGADGSMHLAALYPHIPRAIFLEDPPIFMPGEPIFGGDIGRKGGGALKMMATI